MYPVYQQHFSSLTGTSDLPCAFSDMPSYSPSRFFKKPRRLLRRKPSAHPLTSDTVEIISEPALIRSSFQLPSPPTSQESTVISTIYRNTSDAAQAFLSPVQAVADIIPGIGSIIKGAIGVTLSVLQLVDVIRLRSGVTALFLVLNLAIRDTSRTRKTWSSSPFDYTYFATI